ncbi:MAG TPA: hypothetical protein VFI23_08990 [Rhizomicrobium sp.]|nr:hypothetical protein [Rhizomicrobium sp.]
MLDFIGHVVGLTAIAINLVAMTNVLPLSFRQKVTLGGGVGAWVGLATALAAAGALTFSPEHPVPLVGVFFTLPLLGTALAWRLLPKVRAALLSIPMPLLIGLHTARVLGILFLFLAAAGRLSGPFPYFAGIGDIITGAAALPLALSVARSAQDHSRRIAVWNAFGALDLFTAVGLGITSAQGSPLQLIHAGAGSFAMQYLPYALVPTVLVPFYLITHGIVAAQLRASSTAGRAASLRTASALQ